MHRLEAALESERVHVKRREGLFEGKERRLAYQSSELRRLWDRTAALERRLDFASVLLHRARKQLGRDKDSPWFDQLLYLERHPDALKALATCKAEWPEDHWRSLKEREPAESYLPEIFALFDETAYLDQDPNVAKAVKAGKFLSGREHFVQKGCEEILLSQRFYRHPALDTPFDEAAYLEQNPDVAKAVAKGDFGSGREHFLASGFREIRNGQRRFRHPAENAPFDEDSYLAQNPDVAKAAAEGGRGSGREHFVRFGHHEILLGLRFYRHPAEDELFDEEAYLEQNPDVAKAVAKGDFSSGREHFMRNGYREIRDGRRRFEHPALVMPFDEDSYLAQNPDVARAVAAGDFPTGRDHFLARGYREIRSGQRLYRHPAEDAPFDEKVYLEQNPDVAQAVSEKIFASARQHFYRTGFREIQEGLRKFKHPALDRPFDESAYLSRNPDIAKAMERGDFPSAQSHYFAFGWKEIHAGHRTPQPLFTVVAAVYNKRESLPIFLEAFRRQDAEMGIELIFVDDGSTDGSREFLREEAERWHEHSLKVQVRYIENETNLGNVRSRLRGLTEARGDWVAVMDADCIVNPGFLREHLRSHAKGFYQIVVGPMNVETNGCEPFALLAELEADPERLEREMALQEPGLRQSFLNNITRNFSIQRRFLSEDILDPDFSYSKDQASGFGWEDVEMGYRLYLRGLRTDYNSAALSVHLSHPSSVDERSKPVRSIKNFWKLFEKHPDLVFVVNDWARETLGKIRDWLASVDQSDNADLKAVETIFAKPEVPHPVRRVSSRRLRILSYRWHCGHQYEIHRLPHDFTLVQGGNITDWWDYGQRPLRPNVRFLPQSQVNYDEYDLAILHFDEFVLRPELSKGILCEGWGSVFQELQTEFKGPKVAICHGVPYFYGACDLNYRSANLGRIVEEERQAMVDFLGDTMAIVNSHRAQRDWGFRQSKVIWHGFDPQEYPPSCYRKGAIVAVGHMLKRPHYRGLGLYLKTLDQLNSRGVLLPDFLGDALANQVNLPRLDKAYFDSDNERGWASFQNYVSFLRDYSIFFNTTQNSPMPRTRAEAMLCGLAMVTTNCHDEDMFIEQGINGFYSNDPRELAQILGDLQHDPGLTRTIGQAGRRRALEAFHIDNFLNEWNETLGDLLGESLDQSAPRPARYSTIPRSDKTTPSVLFLSGVDGDTQRYRVDHIVEGLHQAGMPCRKLAVSDPLVLDRITGLLEGHDIVVLHRVTYSSLPGQVFATLKDRNKLVLFDTDDMVFDPSFHDYFERLGIACEGLKGLIPAYQETLDFCRVATCTTHFLQGKLQAIGMEARILRNCFSAEMRRLSALARNGVSRSSDEVVIGYPSGTVTHALDFAQVTPTLTRLFREYPQVRLHIVGHLESPEELEPFADRIIRTGFISWRALPRVIASFDINLAPLVEAEAFCQSKSELKWLEAGLVSVPSVCSRTDAFEYAVRDGETGFLASGDEEWYVKLARLVEDTDLRRRMGEAALADTLERYSPEARGREAAELYRSLLEKRR